ncbi:uncharacterized protein TRIADDRAFT_49562 [Trichoplax adhaerens]|uniref:UDP-N-acetylglucosamine transporter n=1 Tax=Trichoplax adhaerens TaxID=10228 RepID=B3RIW3_TRIAD|nr:hypothetical protein TRIADDRAFT_49562 [Trichoplax adhaerens]EDV28459.1 hypothetical protein TRIADDRAFT_49562 [Trichoplax adhaerens]|eukprot:XP_002107661.1 hypothetical protein TRIADDRAFT_49562 [Trichoplax adhaerens]
MKENKNSDGRSNSNTDPTIRIGTINVSLKYISLFTLTLQTTALVLIMRYSRTIPSKTMYLVTTAVVIAEAMKVITCLLIIFRQVGFNFHKFTAVVRDECIGQFSETIKLAIPAGLYTVQNNLLYIALSNLDAATYQVTYQLKILTTAVFSVTMLGRRLSSTKWIALVLLMAGVSLVQMPTKGPHSSKDLSKSKQFLGLVAVLTACLSSGFSGVYFEKILKGTKSSIWVRNVQLGTFGFIFGLMGMLYKDYDALVKDGFFQGYNNITWIVVSLQAIGGLIVAVVVKYADNILKGFATSISIITSSLLSYYVLQDFIPSQFFVYGTCIVLVATYLYSKPDAPAPSPPTSSASNKV